MPSFDAVNYAVRPNKAVERKLAFAGLARLSRIIDLADFRYVGLGSVWFVDFIMAHKILGLKSMVSIENNQIGFSRARFNCPYSCIEVVNGDTTEILPSLRLAERPSLVWLDYDSSIGGPVLKDIQLLVAHCAPNSIVIVTINAKPDELPSKNEAGVDIDPETSLRQIAGDMVPTPLPQKSLQRSNYPKLLCEVLANQFANSATGSGRNEPFIKLFDLVYSDGTPMVTVGGIVPAADKEDAVRGMVTSAEWKGVVHEPISVPPLTVKEKLALDRLLPSAQSPTDRQMGQLGFMLKREQIDTYYRHYRDYPMFGEIQM